MKIDDYDKELNLYKNKFKKEIENIDKNTWKNKLKKFLFYDEKKAKLEMELSLIIYKKGFREGFYSALKLSNKQFKDELEKDL